MQMKLQRKPLVAVEGNIGSGKSTCARELAKRMNLRLLKEPLDEELLALFYNDPNQWSFPFQMDMLHSRWGLQMSAACETIIDAGFEGAILDRTLLGDAVFAWKLTEDGIMHPKLWEIYVKSVRNMSFVLFPPTVLLYLTASPETCMERIKIRGREQEKDITMEYLEGIHRGYQELVSDAQSGFFPWSHAVRVLPVPWDVDAAGNKAWERTAQMVREACRMAERF